MTRWLWPARRMVRRFRPPSTAVPMFHPGTTTQERLDDLGQGAVSTGGERMPPQGCPGQGERVHGAVGLVGGMHERHTQEAFEGPVEAEQRAGRNDESVGARGERKLRAHRTAEIHPCGDATVNMRYMPIGECLREAVLKMVPARTKPVSYTHLRAHETDSYLVCR